MGVNLVQKQCNVWDTSEIERTGGSGHTGYSTYTYNERVDTIRKSIRGHVIVYIQEILYR